MKLSRLINRIGAMIAVVILLSLTGYAADNRPAGGSFTFTTKSKEARELVDQVIKRIESFQFADQIQPLAKKAVEADPTFAFAHYLVGATTFPATDAQPHIDKAVELSKTASDAERRYIQAMTLVRAQKPLEAVEIFTALAKEYPQERLVRMMLGQIYLNGGKFDLAKAEFEKAIQLDGSTPRAYALIGNCYLFTDNYTKARELYLTSLTKKAEGTAPFAPNYGLAYSYIYEGNVAEALKVLEHYKDEYIRTGGIPDLPAVFIWNSIGRLLLENGRAEESIKAYEHGYETVPGSSLPDIEKKIWFGRLHHGKGRALSKLGKHEEAWKEAELIKKMIDENGDRGKEFMPSYHYIAGYLKLEAGEYAVAIEHLKNTDPNNSFHKLLLARAYDRSGDKENARKVYQEIVNSTQNNIERALSYPEAKKRLQSL